jgi:hypothetical protein
VKYQKTWKEPLRLHLSDFKEFLIECFATSGSSGMVTPLNYTYIPYSGLEYGISCYNTAMLKAQDITILVKIIALENKEWSINDLSSSLSISQSEVSKALSRLAFSGLIDETKKSPAKNSLFDVIVNSIMFLFPVRPGQVLKGIPTAHSVAPLSKKIRSSVNYIWPDPNGTMRGESIEPLYKTVPKIVGEDKKFYEMMALIDALRVGKSREQVLAKEELRKRFGLV